jgi:hypothetical protein
MLRKVKKAKNGLFLEKFKNKNLEKFEGKVADFILF